MGEPVMFGVRKGLLGRLVLVMKDARGVNGRDATEDDLKSGYFVMCDALEVASLRDRVQKAERRAAQQRAAHFKRKAAAEDVKRVAQVMGRE